MSLSELSRQRNQWPSPVTVDYSVHTCSFPPRLKVSVPKVSQWSGQFVPCSQNDDSGEVGARV